MIKVTNIALAEYVGLSTQCISDYKNSKEEKIRLRYDIFKKAYIEHLIGVSEKKEKVLEAIKLLEGLL